MTELKLPFSYAILPEEEQRAISGGGDFSDALNNFFDNLHLDDLFFGAGLISFSFTFVPVLLFKVVKTGIVFAFDLYDKLSQWLGFKDDTVESAQRYAQERQAESVSADQTNLTNGLFHL